MASRRYNILASTDYGTMIINRFDAAVSFNLSINGSWDRIAVQVLQQIARALIRQRKRIVAVDVGANLGAISVPLARVLEDNGVVHAFEPQRLIYYMLCGNVAIASLENVYCHRLAVSEQPGGQIELPTYRLDKIVNIGAYQLEKTEDTDFDGVATGSAEQVDVVSLDSFGLERLDLLKIDVEGMELKVLEGAAKLIEQYRPAILFEALKGQQDPLKQFFWQRDYRLYDYLHNTLAVPRGLFTFSDDIKEIPHVPAA